MGDGSPERGLRVWLGVRLAAFTNLDLLQQGDYRVRCALQLRGPAEGARGRALAPEHTFAPASIAFIDQRVFPAPPPGGAVPCQDGAAASSAPP